MWLTYAQARKGILDSTHLRSLSGTTFAVYVINYVAAGCVAFVGIMIAFALTAVLFKYTYSYSRIKRIKTIKKNLNLLKN